MNYDLYTNELFNILPIAPPLILGVLYNATQNLLIFIIAVIRCLLLPMIKRFTFRYLRFEVDFDEERG